MDDPLGADVAIAARRHLAVPERRTADDEDIPARAPFSHILTHMETPRANIFSYSALEE